MNASTFKESSDQFDKRNEKNYPDAAEYPFFIVQNIINNFFHSSNNKPTGSRIYPPTDIRRYGYVRRSIKINQQLGPGLPIVKYLL